MKSKFAIRFAIVYCLCCLMLFAGCQQLPQINDEIVTQILEYYSLGEDSSSSFSVSDYRIRSYYGCYNGAYVFTLDTYVCHYNRSTDSNLVVEGLVFETTNHQLIQVFYNGKGCSFVDAYSQGIITHEHLLQIHKLFCNFGADYINGKRIKRPVLPSKIAQELNNCIDYYGCYNGVYVYSTMGIGLDVISATKIGERNIYLGSDFALMAMVDGNVTPFASVSERLSERDLQELYDMIMYVGVTYK